MGLQQIFQNDCLTMSVDTENGYLLNKWGGFPHSAPYRAALEKTLEMLQQHQLSDILVDTTEWKPAAQEDMEWFTNDWIPRAIKVGAKRMAVMVPTSAIANMAIHRVIDSLSNFQTHYFDTQAACTAWFKEA